jgi:alkanesulfonate monooxygenase SsuD/methylene tetrahydromethanopterin reductase-like flavin-dependent oxidoreductase (luciferase family)
MLRLDERVRLGMMFPAGERAESLRFARAAEEAGLDSLERYRTNLELMASEAQAAGRAERPFSTAALLFTALDASYEAAFDRAAALLGRLYARPFREAAAKYCLLGRPDDCLEGIRRFVEAGVRHVILAPLGDPGELLVEARALVPAVHALAPPQPAGA